jgi:hypothetical protein
MPNSVSTSVYKYNPNGFWLLGIYIICLVIAIYHSLSMSVGQMAFFGALFLAVPLYVQYGSSNKIRMLVPDDRSLIFSNTGITFGDLQYPIEEIETAAIYLESFTGFEYRNRIAGPGGNSGPRNMYVKSNGDQNKISFRYKGTVEDFTFCLASYADFCKFRAVINDWLASEVNIALRQVFDDEFIIGEMTYYHTDSGLS